MGDYVFLNVMPKREVIRFNMRWKLAPRCIGPFKILERVGTIAYRLALPSSLSCVQEVFNVSMLHKYTPNLAHVVDWGEITVEIDWTFEEGPVRTLDSRDQVWQCKTMWLVKVLWQHRGVEEATWELEDTMRATYHFLFEDEGACIRILLHVHVFVCASMCEFWGRNFVKGERM